jgi:hypothetical protein
VKVLERSSISDISRLVERALANCVNKPAGDIKLTVAEWHRQLSQFPASDLHVALDEHFRRSQWWPAVSEILDGVRAKIEPPQLPAWSADREAFARNGRTEAEEIAYRKAVIAKAWADARRDNPEVLDEPAGGPAGDAPRASQSMVVSDALRHSCAARRARGERTCGDDEGSPCVRTGIGVRKCKIDRELGL